MSKGSNKFMANDPQSDKSVTEMMTNSFEKIAKDVFEAFDIPKDLAKSKAGEVSTMENIRFMNMKLLALSYAFMIHHNIGSVQQIRKIHFDPHNTNYRNFSAYYLDNMPKNSTVLEREYNSYVNKINQSILRYVAYIENENIRRNKNIVHYSEEEEEEEDYY